MFGSYFCCSPSHQTLPHMKSCYLSSLLLIWGVHGLHHGRNLEWLTDEWTDENTLIAVQLPPSKRWAHEWSPEGPIALVPVQRSALKLLASHGTWTTRLTQYMFRLPLVKICPYFELSATSRSVCGFLYCSWGYFFTNHSLLYHSKQLVQPLLAAHAYHSFVSTVNINFHV